MRSNISGTNRLEWFLKDSESQGNSQPTRVDFGFLLDSPQRTKRKGTCLVTLRLRVRIRRCCGFTRVINFILYSSLPECTYGRRITHGLTLPELKKTAISWFTPNYLVRYGTLRLLPSHPSHTIVILFQGRL